MEEKNVSGPKVGGIGSQKNSRSLQIIRRAKAPERYACQQHFLVSFDDFSRHVGREPARRNGIYLDVVHTPLARQVFREDDHSALASAVTDGRETWRGTAKPATASDVDDFSAASLIHDLPYPLRDNNRSTQPH